MPDITTLGKIIGGGLPVGAVAGPAAILDHFTPDGRVFQAGTLSGNPLAMAAGAATLRALEEPGVYERLETAGARFTHGMDAVFTKHGIPHRTDHRGSMTGFFFTAEPVVDLESAKTSDTAFYGRFFMRCSSAAYTSRRRSSRPDSSASRTMRPRSMPRSRPPTSACASLLAAV